MIYPDLSSRHYDYPECLQEFAYKLTQYLSCMYQHHEEDILTINLNRTILNINNVPSLGAPKKPIRPGESYDNLNIQRYWNINNETDLNSDNLINDEERAIIKLDQVLGDAVKRQMIYMFHLERFFLEVLIVQLLFLCKHKAIVQFRLSLLDLMRLFLMNGKRSKSG